MKKKKAKGVLDDFLPIMCFLLFAVVIIFLVINYNAAVNQKTDLNAIGRKYMLKIETYGYLRDSDKISLANELNDAGFFADNGKSMITPDNIENCLKKTDDDGTITRTTETDVGYGKDVTLVISVYTDVSMLKSTDIFNPKFADEPTKIQVVYESTSKE